MYNVENIYLNIFFPVTLLTTLHYGHFEYLINIFCTMYSTMYEHIYWNIFFLVTLLLTLHYGHLNISETSSSLLLC